MDASARLDDAATNGQGRRALTSLLLDAENLGQQDAPPTKIKLLARGKSSRRESVKLGTTDEFLLFLLLMLLPLLLSLLRLRLLRLDFRAAIDLLQDDAVTTPTTTVTATARARRTIDNLQVHRVLKSLLHLLKRELKTMEERQSVGGGGGGDRGGGADAGVGDVAPISSALTGAALAEVERQKAARKEHAGLAAVQTEQLWEGQGAVWGAPGDVGGGAGWGGTRSGRRSSDENGFGGAYFYGAPGLRPGAKTFEPGGSGSVSGGGGWGGGGGGGGGAGDAWGQKKRREEGQQQQQQQQQQRKQVAKPRGDQVYVLEVQMALAIECEFRGWWHAMRCDVVRCDAMRCDEMR